MCMQKAAVHIQAAVSSLTLPRTNKTRNKISQHLLSRLFLKTNYSCGKWGGRRWDPRGKIPCSQSPRSMFTSYPDTSLLTQQMFPSSHTELLMNWRLPVAPPPTQTSRVLEFSSPSCIFFQMNLTPHHGNVPSVPPYRKWP